MRWRLKDGKHVDSTVLESLIMDTEYSGTLFIRMAPDAHLTNEKKRWKRPNVHCIESLRIKPTSVRCPLTRLPILRNFSKTLR